MGALSAMQSTSSTSGEGEDGLPAHHGHSHAHGSRLTSGRTGFLMKLMGLDRFAQKRDREGLVQLGRENRNPFDLGCIGNCRDFWSTGREVSISFFLSDEIVY